MTVYVRAARAFNPTSIKPRGGQITGSVLHLATFQLEDPMTTTVMAGSWLPLCGGRGYVRPVERWALTGPNSKDWSGHAHWRVCRRCAAVLGALWAAAAEQDARYTAGLDARYGLSDQPTTPERTLTDA